MSIATEITALQADKTAIASAITAKGGTVASGDGFDNFATDVGTIPTGFELPSFITKVDSGSFTVATAPTSGYSVSHSLGEMPKLLLVWDTSINYTQGATIDYTYSFLGASAFDRYVREPSGTISTPFCLVFYASSSGRVERTTSSSYIGYLGAYTDRFVLCNYSTSQCHLIAGHTYEWFVAA